ncbi:MULTISPECIES: SPOR domain-containing protein [unclassified Rhodanobacter]|uniref:SPOR domain-containing protein n=1 Tax=unclassified Rhodanobacter TaxID=2621553 RepID=UPI001BDE7F6A|nr:MULTISPECIES: SPOR domain-containing protein [unclassified Rhodanobacter]MBT2142793.1 SPOR domain-containing protein [Rhodanobacter sp. LX-99]MBT2148134.1 SPOR domain-containing protein [Rhodanobacter sp. LX-100]
MKTRLLGAAVLIALAVLFVPMFFSSTPPAPGGDQAVSLAIPPAPDRDLQTRTMSLTPDAAASGSSAATASVQSATPASSDRLATVDIGSSRPRDVETDPEAGKPPQPTTVTTGSGTSPSQPVIPQQATPQQAAANTHAPAATKPAVATPTRPAAAAPAAPAPVTPAAGRGSYTLNLSAYASAAGAANLERRVRELGYPVSGHAITQAGKSRTLVIAGPFETRAAAEAARLKITQSIPGVPARLEQDASRESSTAATPTPAATTIARAGGWAVQLAAMSNQADANALRDKLRANGFDGFVDSVQSGGKRLWRVRAGPQTQRSDAQRVHDQIKAKLGIDGNVVSVP